MILKQLKQEMWELPSNATVKSDVKNKNVLSFLKESIMSHAFTIKMTQMICT